MACVYVHDGASWGVSYGKNMQKTSDHKSCDKNMQAVAAPRKNVVGAGGPWGEDSSGSDSECIQLIPEQK